MLYINKYYLIIQISKRPNVQKSKLPKFKIQDYKIKKLIGITLLLSEKDGLNLF